MSKEDVRQLETMVEIIARAIPKEANAAKLYAKTAKGAKRELTRMLFAKLQKDAEEHETKLSATLKILSRELDTLRGSGGEVEESGTCMPAHEFNVSIRRTLRLTKDMHELAKDGLAAANDPSCRKMYDTIQAFADTMHEMATEEIEKHIDKDKWD